jgi:hypothetical protein
MNRIMRARPSPAMVVALVALFVSLGGTAAALQGSNTVFSDDIVDGQVRSQDISNTNGVRSVDVRNDNLTGGGLTAADLGANSVLTAEIGTGAVTGGKVAANTLGTGQVSEASLDYASAGCKLGLVHSFARIKGGPGMPSTYTTSSTWRDFVHNCASRATTEVRRFATGGYLVRFNGDPAALAVVSANFDATCPTTNGFNHIATVRKETTGPNAGAFQILTRKASDLTPQDACVTIMTF